jgi:preprotein translocase subunit SecE
MAENTNVKKPSIFTRIKKFWKDYRSEFKKLVWPTPKQLLKNSAVVLVSVIVVGAVLALVDFGLSKGFFALQDLIKQIMPAG